MEATPRDGPQQSCKLRSRPECDASDNEEQGPECESDEGWDWETIPDDEHDPYEDIRLTIDGVHVWAPDELPPRKPGDYEGNDLFDRYWLIRAPQFDVAQVPYRGNLAEYTNTTVNLVALGPFSVAIMAPLAVFNEFKHFLAPHNVVATHITEHNPCQQLYNIVNTNLTSH